MLSHLNLNVYVKVTLFFNAPLYLGQLYLKEYRTLQNKKVAQNGQLLSSNYIMILYN